MTTVNWKHTKGGKISRSQGQRIGSTAVADPLAGIDVPIILSAKDMPNMAALSCPGCGKTFFHVNLQGKIWNLGCSNCAFESKLSIPGVTDDGSNFNATLRCMNEHCNNDAFSFIRVQEKLGVGCNKCFGGIEIDLDKDDLIIVPK